MTLARFLFWVVAVLLISFGAYQINPALAFISAGGIILAQVLIGEIYAIHASARAVSKRK